jgi:dTDP-4-dehydrorhamnose reductase
LSPAQSVALGIMKRVADHFCDLSGGVFDGTKGNYLENNEPNSDDIYGKTKFLGEINYHNTCTIRTSIIGHEYYNKLSLLEWFLSNKNKCNGFSNSFFSGLTTLEVYKFLVNSFLKKKYSGLLHLHSKKISKDRRATDLPG